MNNNKLSTGNVMVDEISKLSFIGNIIPAKWYSTIVRNNGKPYLNAIIILADIVYWYRWSEVRDEISGQLLGVRKRFKGEVLQRNYQQMSNMFGMSKREAQAAVIHLEELGVLKRDPKNINSNGLWLPNVMYLLINTEVLKELTYGKSEDTLQDKQEGGSSRPIDSYEILHSQANIEVLHNNVTPPTPKSNRVLQNNATSSTPKSNRVLQNNVTPPTSKSNRVLHYNVKGLTGSSDTYTKNTTKKTNIDLNPIISDERAIIENKFKKQIEYELLVKDSQNSPGLINDLTEVAIDVLTSNASSIWINKEARNTIDVQSKLWSMNMTHLQYAHDCLDKCSKEQKNLRSYLITTLYNSLLTSNAYYANRINVDKNAIN